MRVRCGERLDNYDKCGHVPPPVRLAMLMRPSAVVGAEHEATDLIAGPEHDLLRRCECLVIHSEVLAFDLDQQHAKVGSAQIQCQELAFFRAGRHLEPEEPLVSYY